MNYATETYMTEKIMDLINNYHKNILKIVDIRRKYVKLIGVNDNGKMARDPLEKEIVRMRRMDKELGELEKKVFYIQDRLDRITDERQIIVLDMRMSGDKAEDISKALDCSSQTVYGLIKKIAYIMQDERGVL